MRDGNDLPLSHEAVYQYLELRARTEIRDPVLDAMESYAANRSIPLIGRAGGRFLEVSARAIGARRVFELGSGFGYSAYWFATAVGPAGEVVCTEKDADSSEAARELMDGTPQWTRIRYLEGDPGTALDATSGEFDVIFCDAIKSRYPELWKRSAERLRIGGLYVADNALWHGGVVSGQDVSEATVGFTQAILEHHRLIADDPRYITSMVPIRDGLLIALRVA